MSLEEAERVTQIDAHEIEWAIVFLASANCSTARSPTRDRPKR